jgi:hypothetical protein
MSHDRGCPCGKEPYEYADCVKQGCFRKENKVEDTGGRYEKQHIERTDQ